MTTRTGKQPQFVYLILNVLCLADGRVAVAARGGVERPTYVDVILPQVRGVGQIHDLPVAAGGGP